MFSFLKKIFEKNNHNNFNTISLEQLKAFRKYALDKNLINNNESEFQKVKNLLFLNDLQLYLEDNETIKPQFVPEKLKITVPFFGYISEENNEIKYYYSEKFNTNYFQCPETKKTAQVKLLSDIFHYYYDLFHIDDNQQTKKDDNPFSLTPENKVDFIDNFLKTENYENFEDTLYDSNNIVMLIDWREEDKDIVTKCERILKTNELKPELTTNNSQLGYSLHIIYQEKKYLVPHYPECSFRDITLQALNQVIALDYEIRWYTGSDGQDTLLFIPLSKEQWNYLDKKHPKNINNHFIGINNNTIMFG